MTSGRNQIKFLKNIRHALNYVTNHVTTSRNKGSVPQSLISCRLAGWVKDKQFSVEIPQKCENSPEPYLLSVPVNQENLSKAEINPFNNSGGTAYESLNHTSIMKNEVIPGTVK